MFYTIDGLSIIKRSDGSALKIGIHKFPKIRSNWPCWFTNILISVIDQRFKFDYMLVLTILQLSRTVHRQYSKGVWQSGLWFWGPEKWMCGYLVFCMYLEIRARSTNEIWYVGCVFWIIWFQFFPVFLLSVTNTIPLSADLTGVTKIFS